MVKLLNCFILFFCLYCVRVTANPKLDFNSSEDALNYINELQKKVNSTKEQDIILVIGNTGCGKSTLVHYVTGDYSKMFAEDPPNPNSVNFEIRDELDPDRNRITLPTESRTLVPVISIDETHSVWVDCPGFGDTRNETVEIATAFLIRKVIENASNIKIVLVVNYDSVTKSNNRDDFDNLLMRATQLMRNTGRFENCVSLVVTKAPSFKIRGRQITDIFEDSIKNTTAQFMIDHRSMLEKKETFGNKIQLIDSLLKRNMSLASTNEYYPRISIFWRPNEAGPFDKIGKMIGGRQTIRKSIFEHSSYSEIRINDFGFPLTPQAQLKVINMLQHTVDVMSTTLQHNVDQLIVEIHQQIQSVLTIKGRLKVIDIGINCIQTQNIGHTITLNQLSELLKLLVRAYNSSASDVEELHQIERNEPIINILNSLIVAEKNSTKFTRSSNLDYNSFLEQVINFLNNNKNEIQKSIEHKAKELVQLVFAILTKVDNQLVQALQRKFEFIRGFQNRLKMLHYGKNITHSGEKELTLKRKVEQLKYTAHAYEILSINISALNYLDRYEKELTELKSLAESQVQLPVRDWIAVSSNTINYLVSMYDWYLFLEETYQYFGRYENQKLSTATPIIDENNFIEITKRIRRSAEYEPTSNKINEMNEIINITMQSPSFECDDDTLVIKGHFVKSSDIQDAIVKKCSSLDDLTTIQVFALDTFYVDSDLYLNKTKEVDLRIMAPTWNILKTVEFNLNGVVGERHDELNTSGTIGKPGNPGTNGGNFIGWANDILNGDWLSVELNGGRGGNGQDGTGSSDVDVIFERTTFSEKGNWDDRTTDLDNYYLRYFRENGYKAKLVSSRSNRRSFAFFTRDTEIWQTFILYPNECCGSIGAGGEGGIGGFGGRTRFLGLGDKVKRLPKIISEDGENGDDGLYGRRCSNFMLRLSIHTYLKLWLGGYEFTSEFYDKKRYHNFECPTRFLLEFQYPKYPKINFGPLGVVQSLIEYKSILLKSMNNVDDPAVNIALKAYNIISSDPDIHLSYSIWSFIMEAIALEQFCSELEKKLDILPLYDDLLKRLKNYWAKNEANLSNIDQRIVVLTYTMLFSKIRGMRSSHSSDLVINIGNFLELTAQNVGEMNELKRVNMINEQREEYNNVIMTKIQEATNFINNDIVPEIEQKISMLNSELKNAVDETVKFQTKTIHEIYAKEDTLRIIRRNVIARTVLDVFGVVRKFISMVLAAKSKQATVKRIVKFVDATVDIVVNNIENKLADPTISIHEVPQGVQQLRNRMGKNHHEKLEAAEMGLNNLKILLQNYNITNLELSQQLNIYITNISEMKSNSSLEKHVVADLLNRCTGFLRRWQNVYLSSDAHNRALIVRSIRRAQHALTMIAASFSTYQQISSDDDEKINEVIRAINEDHETLEALTIFEDGIYSELMPMVDEMYEYFAHVQDNLKNKSSVALDVESWNVKKILQGVQKKFIDELTQFEVESNVKECMNRIIEAIKLTIDIYDRIQNYQEDFRLVTFLSDIHAARAVKVDASHSMQQIMNELETNIQKNLILGQYSRVLGAFKQSVFPYAADYSDEFPSSLVDDSSTLITFASQQIKSLCKNLVEYNDTVISENDELIHLAFFDRDNGSRGPFYVWPNSEVRDKIQLLFEEKTIYLLADVHKSDSRNAVKFNKIELEFHSDNQTVNTKLHEVLQSFHVSLTHLGNSNYRCNNTFYTIPSRPWNIKYSIAERNQSPADRNSVYSKLNAGSSLLSPYTLWAVQLFYGHFDQLTPFSDLVDIELHGFGLYVEENAPICETNLEKYYSVMDNS